MTYKTPWGSVGYLTYKRTYAREIKPGVTEEFTDTVERILKACDKQLKCGFTEDEEERLRKYFLELKGSVAGRFLWQLGTSTVNKLGLASLQNCAATVVDSPIRPFTWAMDMLMLGSGVGYNIQKEYVYQLPKIKKAKIVRQDNTSADFIVPDTREGWVKLLGRVLKAHFLSGKGFSYSTHCIRSKGASIGGFGGIASGPEELCWGMEKISEVLNRRSGKKAQPIDCLDIMNIIGYVVVAGNVRRSAQIAIGDVDDIDFLRAKRWDLGGIPNWRAMSNNSVVVNDISKLPEEFWEGYKGNGEPYGLINLELSRSVGRLGETEYADPDVVAYNPCVSGDTPILTKNGHKDIEELVGQEVEIWNGEDWATVTPKITGENQKMLEVFFSNGRTLKCTPYHKFQLSRGYKGEKEKLEAKDLRLGDKLIKWEPPVIKNGVEDNLTDMYTRGIYAADGTKNTKVISLYNEKIKLHQHLSGNLRPGVHNTATGATKKYFRVSCTLYGKSWVPRFYGLPERLAWFAGLLDGDGCELKEGGAQVVSVDKQFLLDVQLMLQTCGTDSKVVEGTPAGKREMPDGKGGYALYECQETHRLCVSAKAIQDLKTLGMKCKRLQFDKTPNRDASRFVTITGVKELDSLEEFVYCFNEPKKHLGIFNGVITGQCAEQSLANMETCCLSEVYLPNIDSEKEFKDIATLLYRINKHSLRLKCHHPETQDIVHKHTRMGIGVTGVMQATAEQKSWLKGTYNQLRTYDKEYSKRHNWPESIKISTVKPSGTLSLLPGVTPGAHPGFSQYFIRRIRIASNSPLVQKCRNVGYNVEHVKNLDGTDDHNTVVVEFPCSYPKHTVMADQVTAIQQLENVKWLQTVWSDNAVSCTIYYRIEELDDIKEWLVNNYKEGVKTCSFLLHQDHGFAQAPYEEITKDVYNEMKSKCRPLDNITVNEDDVEIQDCDTGACPIK